MTVQLWNAEKTQLLYSSSTNASRTYSLTASVVGNYRVRVVLPNSTVTFSPANQAGGNDSTDSDITQTGVNRGFSGSFFVSESLISTVSLDAGLISNMTVGHTIGDRCFIAAADGTQTPQGVSATVQLLNSAGAILQTTETVTRGGNLGYYSFSAAPGTYRLKFLPNSPERIPTPNANAGGDDSNDSDIASDGRTPLFTLAAGEVRDDLDAGFVTPVNLGSFVWDDEDRDGNQDSSELGVANVTVQLWNAAKTRLFHSDTTDSNGRYLLVGPGPGDYRIRVLLPQPGVSFSAKNAASGDDTRDSDINSFGTHLGFSDIYTIESNVISITHIDAGLISDLTPGHQIGDFVFTANADGTQSSNGINGVTVQLLSEAGAVLQTTVSRVRNSEAGYYSFAAAPGNYRLRFTTPPGRIPTPLKDAGGDDENDSDVAANGETDVFTIAHGQRRTDLDAGYLNNCAIGNFIWNDLNENGLQDTGEPGLPNVIVELWDSLKTTRLDETVSNSNGNFTLYGTAPGNFRIYVIRPHPSDTFSPITVGDDITDDSNISSSTTNFGFSPTIVIDANVISITSYDAGIILGSGARIMRPLRITQLNLPATSLQFSGTTGGTYSLEHSTTLQEWQAIGDGLTTTSATSSFSLPAETLGNPKHFWRVRRIK